MKNSLHLLPKTQITALSKVLSSTSQCRIIVCDFPVDGAQNWCAKPWGFEHKIDGRQIINIDHHADVPAMRRCVSSANLALKYRDENGITRDTDAIVLNHTDCDSVLAAAIISGDIPADPKLGEAAIAADHTGAANPIADLLQALEDLRDYEYSVAQLCTLLAGNAVDKKAQKLLAKRLTERATAKQLVAEGKFTVQNGLAWAILDGRMSGEMFPALLPTADFIAIFYRSKDEPHKWICRVRLGQSAPQGFPLQNIVCSVDSCFGGRWNAGSNSRGGGSILSPSEYTARLLEAKNSFCHK